MEATSVDFQAIRRRSLLLAEMARCANDSWQSSTVELVLQQQADVSALCDALYAKSAQDCCAGKQAKERACSRKSHQQAYNLLENNFRYKILLEKLSHVVADLQSQVAAVRLEQRVLQDDYTHVRTSLMLFDDIEFLDEQL